MREYENGDNEGDEVMYVIGGEHEADCISRGSQSSSGS